MALHHPILSEFGIQASYWRVAVVNDDFVNKKLTVTVLGYVNRRLRLSNYKPISHATFTLDSNDYAPEMGRPEIYKALKLKPEFKGSLDC